MLKINTSFKKFSNIIKQQKYMNAKIHKYNRTK